MIRSKNIKDYFSGFFSNLQPDRPFGFDIHLFFPQSNHIIVWRRGTDSMSNSFIKANLDRGITRIWIHNDDRAAFEAHCRGLVEGPQTYKDYDDAKKQLEEEAKDLSAHIEKQKKKVEEREAEARRAEEEKKAKEEEAKAKEATEAAQESEQTQDSESGTEEEKREKKEKKFATEENAQNEEESGETSDSKEHSESEEEKKQKEDELAASAEENNNTDEEETENPEDEMTPEELENGVQTEEGLVAAEIIKNEEISKEEKKDLLEKSAKKMIQEAIDASGIHEKKKVEKKNRQVVMDILNELGTSTVEGVNDLLKMAELDPDMAHSANVATYSVIFAMAFGKIDKEILGDLAVAGLLHDIGMAYLSTSVAAKPWTTLSAEEGPLYSLHVEFSLDIIRELAPQVPERVHAIILQHHEKFDGTGYPKSLKGFDLDDLAQLVSIADLMDSIATGQWDGLPRNIGQVFQVMEQFEKARTFPEYFNPEVFSSVLKWTKSETSQEQIAQVQEIVETKSKETLKGAA